jgi:hypothetical protein
MIQEVTVGSRGPIGKRDAERRRVNDVGTVHVEVDEAEIDEIYAEGAWAYEIGIDEDGVPLPDDDWHRIARMWYCSLKRSVQSRYYQSSDWAVAYLLAESLSRDLKPRPLIVDGEAVVDDDGNPRYVTTSINGSSMNAYLKGMTSLLVTEGDRLRVRLEINVNRSQQGTPNAPIDPEDRKLQLLA